MLIRILAVLNYISAGITYYSFHFNGNAEALPYVILTLIIGGIAHIIAEIREQSQVTSLSMDEDAVKALLKGIREYDDKEDG